MKKIFKHIMAWMGICSLSMTASCIDNDPAKDMYYTFTGETVASYLTNYDEFSDFVEVLKTSNMLGLLETYGEFTCFAPTNEAIEQYMAEHGFANIESLLAKKAECDTLAWMHIINGQAIYITDCDESQTVQNMNKRFLSLTCDTTADTGGNIVWRVNGSRLTAHDDSVVNGVMHVVDRVITASSVMTGDMVLSDTVAGLFALAMNLTHLNDSMSVLRDPNYKPDPDFTHVIRDSHHLRIFGGNDTYWCYPEERLYKYTIFVEPDSIFHRRGIYTLEQLIHYADSIYEQTYAYEGEEELAKHRNDYTDRKNPLNRFIAYHMLDRELTYDEMTVSNYGDINSYFQTQLQDIMEFYETMCPFTIMKISDVGSEKYINRCGLGDRASVRGCRILRNGESKELNPNYSNSPNGSYYYIDDILTYNKTTIDKVLNIRMRIDATTLSPDFSNSGARNSNAAQMTGLTGYQFFMMRFMPGFCKNFIFSDKTFYGVHSRVGYFNSWEGDNNACLDNFDIKFRIPPVPANQTYEIRLGYTVGVNRTVVQVYFDDNLTADMPCGIPVDLRKYGPEYGWQSDEELDNDEEKIEANDKTLRNNGYMKGYDAYYLGGGTNPRTQVQCLRRILTTKLLEPEHNYYIRLRQVLDNNAEMSLDYIEIVPKSVYDGPTPEDKH